MATQPMNPINVETQIQSATYSDENDNKSSGDIKNISFRLTVKRISDIDTSKQRFYAEFTIRFKWLADEEEHENIRRALKLSNHDLHEWEPHWTPQISFPNGLSVELHKINIGRHPHYTAHDLGDGKYQVQYDMEVRAYFMVCNILRIYQIYVLSR